jgi:hypothetical protein
MLLLKLVVSAVEPPSVLTPVLPLRTTMSRVIVEGPRRRKAALPAPLTSPTVIAVAEMPSGPATPGVTLPPVTSAPLRTVVGPV